MTGSRSVVPRGLISSDMVAALVTPSVLTRLFDACIRSTAHLSTLVFTAHRAHSMHMGLLRHMAVTYDMYTLCTFCVADFVEVGVWCLGS